MRVGWDGYAGFFVIASFWSGLLCGRLVDRSVTRLIARLTWPFFSPIGSSSFLPGNMESLTDLAVFVT